MRVTTLALALAIVSAFTFTVLAQNSRSSATQDNSMHCMEGMAMPGCLQTDKNQQKMPGMRHDIKNMPGMQMEPTEFSQSPDTHATMTLQEPENPGHKIGSNLPAPELLKEVVARPAMSLADFETLADANNPTLKQANAIVRRSQEQARQTGLYPNPLSGYQGEQIRGGSYGGGEQGGFVQQTIVLGGKLGLRRNIYEQQTRSDQVGLEEQTYRVHGDVQQAFYDALTAQAAVQLRQRLLAVALDALETVHQLANVGQADAPDTLQTEVEAEQAKVDYVTAQRQYLQSFRTLAAFAGKGNVTTSPLQGELEKTPDLNAEQMVDSIVANSPTVKRAQQEAAVAQARLKDAKRESVPDLQLRAGEQYNGEQVSGHPVKPVGAQSFATAGSIFRSGTGIRATLELRRRKLSAQIKTSCASSYLSDKRQNRWPNPTRPQSSKRNVTKRSSFHGQHEHTNCT